MPSWLATPCSDLQAKHKVSKHHTAVGDRNCKKEVLLSPDLRRQKYNTTPGRARHTLGTLSEAAPSERLYILVFSGRLEDIARCRRWEKRTYQRHETYQRHGSQPRTGTGGQGMLTASSWWTVMNRSRDGQRTWLINFCKVTGALVDPNSMAKNPTGHAW